jgi:RNA polymerase sigma-70 factor (ECF subfamily)
VDTDVIDLRWMVPDSWLLDFRAGSKGTLEECYKNHYADVARAAERVLGPADSETVTHEVFYRLLTDREMRESFRGENLRGWLTQIASRRAIDVARRLRREEPEPTHEVLGASSAEPVAPPFEDAVDAKMLIDRFVREELPVAWAGVFDARFIRQLPQRQAATELGLQRTTLVYQEQRILALLRKFLLEKGES